MKKINYKDSLINPKKGSALTKVLFAVAIIALVGIFFQSDINKFIDKKRFNYASKKLEQTYWAVNRLAEKENMNVPEYAYTSYEDTSIYMERLFPLLKSSKHNSDTDFGSKIIIRNDTHPGSKYVYIAYEFRDGRRVISVNGEIIKYIYSPSDGEDKYGKPWLYGINGNK